MIIPYEVCTSLSHLSWFPLVKYVFRYLQSSENLHSPQVVLTLHNVPVCVSGGGSCPPVKKKFCVLSILGVASAPHFLLK